MPNPFCHVELHSNDLEKSKEFYTKLFDWKLEDMPDGNHSYTIIRVAKAPVGNDESSDARHTFGLAGLRLCG